MISLRKYLCYAERKFRGKLVRVSKKLVREKGCEERLVRKVCKREVSERKCV